MRSNKPMDDGVKPFFSGKMFACPLKGHWVSFQLVYEFGDGNRMRVLPIPSRTAQSKNIRGHWTPKVSPESKTVIEGLLY